jgi:hypothetical protein
MKRQLAGAAALVVAILSISPATAFAPNSGSATNALNWLHGLQSTDGTVAGDATRTEETVWGLVANQHVMASFSSSAGKTPIDSLQANIANEEKSAGNIANLIIAVSAAKLDPTAFAGRNLLQDLQCTYDPQTGRYNPQLFNDALAILALPAGSAPSKATSFLASQQQADGGWEFQSGFGSDTNTTAVVLMALVAAGGLSSITRDRALGFFKLHQKPSGGFEYAVPFAPPGDSDPNSDALVVEALLATGEDPTGAGWTTAEKKNALDDLLSFQYPNGGFGFNRPGSSPDAAPDAASTTQALPALASRSLPIERTTGTLPPGCPTATTSNPAAPQATATGSRRLAQTGSSPLVPVAFGLGLAFVGWRMRRRTAH